MTKKKKKKKKKKKINNLKKESRYRSQPSTKKSKKTERKTVGRIKETFRMWKNNSKIITKRIITGSGIKNTKTGTNTTEKVPNKIDD